MHWSYLWIQGIYCKIVELPLLELCPLIPWRDYCHTCFLCEGIRGTNYLESNIIQMVWSHGYFHPILELKIQALRWSIRIHWLTRPGIIVVDGYMGWLPPSNRFFHTTCYVVVYFKTFILSIILRPRIYLLLKATLPLKEGCILHPRCQTNQITTDSKLGTTKVNFSINWFEICAKKGNFSRILAFKPYVYHLWSCHLRRAYLPWPFCWRNWSFHMQYKQVAKDTILTATNWNDWQSLLNKCKLAYNKIITNVW